MILQRGALALLFIAIAVAGLVPALAIAASPEIRFARPDPDALQPGRTPLQIEVPAALQPGPGEALRVELDGIDITALVEMAAGRWAYRPVAALAPGTHELRLYRVAADGALDEPLDEPLGVWRFSVDAPPFPHNAGLATRLDGQGSRRVSEDGLGPTRSQSVARGSGRIEATAETGPVALAAGTDLFYVSDSARSLTGRALDVGTFRLSAHGERIGVVVGDQPLDGPGLLFGGGLRRGVRVATGLPGVDGEMRVFTASTSDRVGRDGEFGVGDRDDRFSGAAVEGQLVDTVDRSLRVSAAYLAGRETRAGFAAFGPEADDPLAGRGWALAIDSEWWARRLRLRLEQAASAADIDRAGQLTEERDTAHRAHLSLGPGNHYGALDWEVGLAVGETGRDFRSLANRYLSTDRATRELFGRLAGEAWSLRGAVIDDEDNVAGDRERPRVRIRQVDLGVGYAARGPPAADGPLAWLGRRSHDLDWSRARSTDRRLPDSAFPTDEVSEQIGLTSRFAYPEWSWSLGLHEREFSDHTDFQSDSRARSLALSADLPVGPRLRLRPGFDHERRRDRDFATTSRATTYRLDSQLILLPRRLTGGVTLNLTRDDARADPFFARDQEQRYFAGRLGWQVLARGSRRPDLEIRFEASRQELRDRLDPGRDRNSYQAFLSLRTELTSTHGSARW